MARKPRSDGRAVGGGEVAHADAIEWFATSDAEVASCHEWDVKAEAAVEAMLLLLSKGRGIMFSLSWDQTEIRVTVYDGERKSARRVGDSLDFDDAMAAIKERAATLTKLPRRDWSEKDKR